MGNFPDFQFQFPLPAESIFIPGPSQSVRDPRDVIYKKTTLYFPTAFKFHWGINKLVFQLFSLFSDSCTNFFPTFFPSCIQFYSNFFFAGVESTGPKLGKNTHVFSFFLSYIVFYSPHSLRIAGLGKCL